MRCWLMRASDGMPDIRLQAAAIDKWIAAGTYTWPGQRAPAEITATKYPPLALYGYS